MSVPVSAHICFPQTCTFWFTEHSKHSNPILGYSVVYEGGDNSLYYLHHLTDAFFPPHFYQAKAKEERQEKCGEDDDTVPAEYRLKPAVVSSLHNSTLIGIMLMIFLPLTPGAKLSHCRY